MEAFWWMLPALAGIMGIIVSFAGLGRLFRLRLAAGGLYLFSGTTTLGLAGLFTYAGLNLQTYNRLTYETVIATISFDQTPNVEDTYTITLILSESEKQMINAIKGDQFSIGAQIITYKPLSQLVGYDSVYRLEYIEGRFAQRYNTQTVTRATSTGLQLAENPGLDVYALARGQGRKFGIEAAQRDTQFGSAVYAPMADGLEYEVSLTQSALVLRPANAAARQHMEALN